MQTDTKEIHTKIYIRETQRTSTLLTSNLTVDDVEPRLAHVVVGHAFAVVGLVGDDFADRADVAATTTRPTMHPYKRANDG